MFEFKNLENAFSVKVSGKLTHEDYTKHFIPKLEELIAKQGKVNLIIEAEDFDGWEWRAAWDDFSTGLKHRHDFAKVAIVGDKDWEQWIVKVFGWIMDAEVRYFDKSQHDTAVNWVSGKN